MNEFKENLRVVEKVNRFSIVSQLRGLADDIERGKIQLDMASSQELKMALAQARNSLSAIDVFIPIEDLQQSLDEFASSIQQATSQGKNVEEKLTALKHHLEEDIEL